VYNHHDEFSVNGLIAGLIVLIFSYWRICTAVDGTWEWVMELLNFILLAYGIPPAISTGVHVAEMFTTGASAISHHRLEISTKN
jgi:hypothetical protein